MEPSCLSVNMAETGLHLKIHDWFASIEQAESILLAKTGSVCTRMDDSRLTDWLADSVSSGISMVFVKSCIPANLNSSSYRIPETISLLGLNVPNKNATHTFLI